jgi:tetratricopeptide (TPR) repeat protein
VATRAVNGILVALFFCAQLLGDQPSTPPLEEQIEKAIRQLGDDSFHVREKATNFLWSAGRAAEPALRQAEESADREVVRRARSVLDKFKWGIYPDTPKEIIELVARYQGGDPQAKRNIVQQLLDKGSAGYLVLTRLAVAEPGADERQALLQQLAQEGPRVFAQLIASGSFAALEGVLETSLGGNIDSTPRNYAAYCLFRGRIDLKISQYASRGGKAAAEILTYLYRAKGDLSSAASAAARSGKSELARAILWEQGAWKELLDRHRQSSGDSTRKEVEAIGFLAAYQRLAGDVQGLGATLAEVKKLATDGPDHSENGWQCAKILLLNDRPNEAIEVLEKTKKYGTAFELLCAQMRYAEAFELAASAKAGDEILDMEIQRGRVLYLLGKTDEARTLFASLGERIKSAARISAYTSLVEIENRLGLKEEALTHAAAILARTRDDAGTLDLLEALCPDKAEVALEWWRFLRRTFPNESPAKSIKRLPDILDGKLPVEALASFAAEGEKHVFESAADRREKWRTALADAFRAAGSDQDALAYLEREANTRSASAQAEIHLADYLTEKKSWEQAAARYGQAWKKDQHQALALYLQGWALEHAGHSDEGKKAMTMARWLPLADDAGRYALGEGLEKRGLARDAEREFALLLRTGQTDSWYVSNARRRLARAALSRKDYLAAADQDERALLDCLRTGTGFVRPGAYLAVPHLVHRQRARGLLAAGRFDDAGKEIELALAALPGEVDVAIELVGDLEKQGRKKNAQELFDRLFTLHEKVCAEYPKSAWAHNTLAWLAARCQRQLQKALTHAETAVKLEPKDTSYKDTLAEVHFQRGETDKAAELMRACTQANPKNAYYRKQLERFKAGDRTVDVPEQVD